MKRALVILLVVIMVCGMVASYLVYFRPSSQSGDQDPFEDVPMPSIKSYRFADFSKQDISGLDLSKVSLDEAMTFTFDTDTKWPPPDKMPSGFSPEETMEKGKYLGLGLQVLHAQGVTGEGISVAVIDTPLLKDHESLPADMEYVEMKPGDPSMQETSFHGALVAGILAGKDGVAPGAHLYYFAVPDDAEPYARLAEAMNRLLEVNSRLPDGRKIRVVAVPYGADPLDQVTGVAGAQDWANAIRAAQDAGIIVVYPGMADLNYTGAGAVPGSDRDRPENYRTWTWVTAKAAVIESLKKAGVTSWDTARKELIRLLTEDPDLDSLRSEAIDTYIYLMASYKTTMSFDEWIKVAAEDLSGALAFPVDYLTVPNAQGEDSYTYYASGGLSFATPYVAGLLALGLQVKADAAPQELLKTMVDTGTPFETGGKLVCPVAFVEALR